MSDIFGTISIEAEKPDTPIKKQKKTSPPPRHRKTKGKGNGFLSKTLIWSLFPLGLLGLYCILGFWGVPYYLSTSIPQLAAKDYNVDISTEKITFNPFNFTLKAEATKVNDQQGVSIASLPYLELQFAPIQLLRMDFVCTKVTLTSPSLHLVRNEAAEYNFNSFIPTLNKNTNSTEMIGFSDLPFSFSLNNIKINAGTLIFEDKPNQKTHNVQNIELQLPTIANMVFQADAYITPHFSAVVNGSPVTFRGQTNNNTTLDRQQPAQLAWEMKNFPLQDYLKYLPFELPFTINKGTAEGIIGLTFDTINKKDETLLIDFKLDIKDIDFETQQKKLQLQAPTMSISGSFSPVKKLFLVETLRFKSPQFIAHTPNLLQELSDIFVVQKKKEQLGIVEEPVVFSLQSLQFTNGTLFHKKTDNQDEDPLEWTQLGANIENYITHDSKTPVKTNLSSVNLTGQRKDSTNKFSYMGSFESPSTLSGKLAVDNINCQNLFSFLLPEQDFNSCEGTAKFDSIFSITERTEGEPFKSSLHKTNITVNNLKILDKNKVVIQAKELSIADAELVGDNINLGTITVKNGNTSYTLKSSSSILFKIISGQYSISNLDYTGDIKIQPVKTKALPFILKNSSIKYSGTNSTQKGRDNISIAGLTSTQGKIDATGTVTYNPLSLALSTAFANVDNHTLSALLPDSNFITNSTGTISGQGNVTFPEISFKGNLELMNGKHVSGKDEMFSWNKFAMEDVKLSSKPHQLDITSVRLEKPTFDIPILPHKGSIDQQLSDFLRSTLNDTQKPITQFPINIQKATLNNGELTLKDHRLNPTWIGEIRDVNGTIVKIDSASSTNESPFSFAGTFDGSDFTWKGTVNPFKNTQTDKYQFILTDYPLRNFAKQLHPLSDINFDSSTISLTYSADWINGDLSHSIRSTLSHLKINTPNSDSALPLALLTDANGSVKLDSSTIQTSSYKDSNLFAEFIADWQKRMIKGSISPLLLVHGDFTDLIDNDFIDFKPGQFMLSDAGRKNLLRYGALLLAHPNIKLKLSGGVSLEEDKLSLHKQLEKNETYRVEKENEKLFAKWQSKKEEYEAQLRDNQQKAISNGEIAESDIPSKVLAGFRPLLPAPVVVDNEMLLELAEKRLDIVRQHLMTQLSLTKGRIEVTETPSISKNANVKGVHIEILPFESSVLFQNEQD